MATVLCVARLAVSHSTTIGPENSYVQIDCKTGCGEKKILGIRSGTTLSVCHCSSSRGQSEAPATAHNSFYLSAGISFDRQWESVLAVAIFHNILSPIFQPQSNIYLLPRLLLTRQVSCGRRVPAAVAVVVANRGETLAESAANAQ